jgi:hypothetical protein
MRRVMAVLLVLGVVFSLFSGGGMAMALASQLYQSQPEQYAEIARDHIAGFAGITVDKQGKAVLLLAITPATQALLPLSVAADAPFFQPLRLPASEKTQLGNLVKGLMGDGVFNRYLGPGKPTSTDFDIYRVKHDANQLYIWSSFIENEPPLSYFGGGIQYQSNQLRLLILYYEDRIDALESIYSLLDKNKIPLDILNIEYSQPRIFSRPLDQLETRNPPLSLTCTDFICPAAPGQPKEIVSLGKSFTFGLFGKDKAGITSFKPIIEDNAQKTTQTADLYQYQQVYQMYAEIARRKIPGFAGFALKNGLPAVLIAGSNAVNSILSISESEKLDFLEVADISTEKKAWLFNILSSEIGEHVLDYGVKNQDGSYGKDLHFQVLKINFDYASLYDWSKPFELWPIEGMAGVGFDEATNRIILSFSPAEPDQIMVILDELMRQNAIPANAISLRFNFKLR